MTKFYTTLLLLFTAAATFAQSGTIKGKALDEKTGETLIGASVFLKENPTKGGIADFDGSYTIANVPEGTHTVVATYISYKSIEKNVAVESGKAAELDFLLSSDDVVLDAVKVVARANRESENTLLLEQRQSLRATQVVGARELSRKGIGNAQAAVAQVSGISKQEGVKNVFVRGLGDRYNATLLNGFPIPSEDPEYKNIALDFFGTDVIQNIGVSKVFNGSDYSDVGGAVIDITSKSLVGDYALGAEVSAGVNTSAVGVDFLRQDGSGYFGAANKKQPANNQFSFQNSLDPSTALLPLSHSYGVSGGKLYKLGRSENPLSFFVAASHSTDFSFTEETVRNTISNGTVIKDQTGEKYSQNTNQLALANATFGINKKHNLQYNFMLIHANNQYVGEYEGRDVYSYEQPSYMGVLRRQQTNDNTLIINQLCSKWELTERLKLDAGISYNTVSGNEPDRRENSFSQVSPSSYIFTSGDNQSRFYSELTDNDFNVKAALLLKLKDKFDSENSALKIGYSGRFTNNSFEGIRYRFQLSREAFNLDELKMDDWYNAANLVGTMGEITGKKFTMRTGTPDSYEVTKAIHSVYAEASYRLLKNLSGNVGLRMDAVDMTVSYKIQGFPGEQSDVRNFLLPSLNLKYDATEKSSLRLGASKTYTLPQAKEISPYQYVSISFTSQGNPKLKPSENYNLDLKWDYYPSASELLSVTGFYKHILNPIGRVDEGNSAGMLTYNNISRYATVGGVEVEVRKNIFDKFNTEQEQSRRISAGLNASYIYTDLTLDISGTTPRSTQLEGASPLLANLDLSYSYAKKDKNLTASLVLSYFSERVHTLGAMGYRDIMEEGVATLNFSASYKLSKHFTVKAKAGNLLNQSFCLTRKTSAGEKVTLNEYKKGQDISIGVGYEF
ncbi:MAG: TonB-dependent receptor [Prevotellaceae bacterium]|nr:TonB-dependent receptor [Prevotellaceae bacterium]